MNSALLVAGAAVAGVYLVGKRRDFARGPYASVINPVTSGAYAGASIFQTPVGNIVQARKDQTGAIVVPSVPTGTIAPRVLNGTSLPLAPGQRYPKDPSIAAGVAGAAGAIAGSFIGGPIGGFIGGWFGSKLGGIF